jgi:hypothetical protein
LTRAKERVLTVVGDRKMAVYDDLDQEKIKVFDKGVKAPSHPSNYAEFQIAYRYGGSYSPFIQEREPLKSECEAFINSITKGQVPLTDGRNGFTSGLKFWMLPRSRSSMVAARYDSIPWRLNVNGESRCELKRRD